MFVVALNRLDERCASLRDFSPEGIERATPAGFKVMSEGSYMGTLM